MLPTWLKESYGVIRITEKSALIYGQSATPPPRTAKQIEAEKNLSRGDKNGYMSFKTKLAVTKILRCWISGIDQFRKLSHRPRLPKLPYFTFVTLTLSAEQMHTDLEVRRKMVIPFIQKLIRTHDVWHYFYVCEKQENGNLHIHLLIDSYIHHKALREEWNQTQAIHGYLDKFQEVYHHRNPNSTDIHKLKDKRSVEAYLVKYMVKDKVNIPIKGRLWGCSDALRKLKPYSEILEGVADVATREMKNSPMFTVKQEENYTLICGPVYRFLEAHHKSLFKRVTEHYINQATELYRIHPELKQSINDNNTVCTPIQSLPKNSKPRPLRYKQECINLSWFKSSHSPSTLRSMVKAESVLEKERRRKEFSGYLLRKSERQRRNIRTSDGK
jgi:hypothetical protein